MSHLPLHFKGRGAIDRWARHLVFAGLILVAAVSSLRAQTYPTPDTFSTLAGVGGQAGYVDSSTASSARFDGPAGVAIDSSGNVYVSDALNNVIRRITVPGVVTTYAGTSAQGSTNGARASATFNSPNGLAVDGSGNIYIADTGNNVIRKIDSAGTVSTLAGSAGTAGSRDGTGTAAQFDLPTDVAVDGAGNVYVADSGNDTIRKITAAGAVTTLAGTAQTPGTADGTGAAARFNGAGGVAVTSAGVVYVADTNNATIRKITAAGVVTTLAGSAGNLGSTDGTGTAARFALPTDVAVDSSGTIYAADANGPTIRKITAAGVVTTLGGRAGVTGWQDGTGSTAQFSVPVAVDVDSGGNLYVADFDGDTIRKGVQYAHDDSAWLPFQNGTTLGALGLATTFAPSAWQGVGTMSSGWIQRAVGDVNGDGISDLIFQNGTNVGALILNSSGLPGTWVGIGSMNAGWQLRGAGEITADGNLDLIFQNGTLLGFLEINAAGVPQSWHGIGSVAAGWQLRAVADLNADGQPELIFQNGASLGALGVGTDGLPRTWTGIGAVGTGWTLSYATDVNADGQPELIFQNGASLGALTVSTSLAPIAWHGIGTMGTGWTLPGDY